MKYFVLAALFAGAAALELEGKPNGQQGKGKAGQDFAMDTCRRDTRVTQLKAEDMNNRMLHLKSARPWMLVKYDNTTMPKKEAPQTLDFHRVAAAQDMHVKRADAMCSR